MTIAVDSIVSSPMPMPRRQHLIFDADDTLWENNRYFETAFSDFVTFLNHEHLGHQDIRDVLDAFQKDNRHHLGYGSRSFATSLRHTFQHVKNVESNDPILDEAQQFGLRILDLEMEPIPGVEETLTLLQPHHDLILLTKGDSEEQRAKIDRSGIEHFFDDTIVVTEKTATTYHETVAAKQLNPLDTWMIGNSPRSDINPALNAGINAVFIPHELTWHLEIEEISTLAEHRPGTLLQLVYFRELLAHFGESSTSN
ncbi:MAG: HAD family hydrolase [Thermomicrobiales bacterium]